MKVARKTFEKRGNHSEAHLTEAELACLVAAGAMCAFDVAALSRERLVKQARELLALLDRSDLRGEIENARDALAALVRA